MQSTSDIQPVPFISYYIASAVEAGVLQTPCK